MRCRLDGENPKHGNQQRKDWIERMFHGHGDKGVEYSVNDFMQNVFGITGLELKSQRLVVHFESCPAHGANSNQSFRLEILV